MHRSLPGYDMPLLALAARVLAALRAQQLASQVAPPAFASRRLPAMRAAPLVSRVPAALGSGPAPVSPSEAEPRLRALLERERFWPSFDLWSALFDAELGGEAGTGTDTALWQNAVDLAASSVAPAYLLPYTRLRLGQAQLESGERAAAQRTFWLAIESADAIGIGLVSDAAARVAAQAGLALDGAASVARLRTDPAHGELTARERQVLDLVAQGLSNRQIGERLFISGKTVSVHVSAILRKLGASSRTEAVFRANALDA
ncbi:helix-turn-helix transcriptional regulator [Luethyella okanaganae]|uniref:LuxR C-terminal-related transcriptional regulator n=1 Tax=Luethyella okanaganae TaxID=69372 RepID=A0ABW1VH99_9MICO